MHTPVILKCYSVIIELHEKPMPRSGNGKRKPRKARDVPPAVRNPKDTHDSELNEAMQASLQQYKADTVSDTEDGKAKRGIQAAIRRSKKEYKSNRRAQQKRDREMVVFVCTIDYFTQLKFPLQCEIKGFLTFEENKILEQIIFRLDPHVQETNKVWCYHAAAGDEWLKQDLLLWQHEYRSQPLLQSDQGPKS